VTPASSQSLLIVVARNLARGFLESV
jgi:hypothetical protein